MSKNKCTHCHLCQENCKFLSKYQIDIGDTKKLEELAYHCFLCGTCSAICPEEIDGREMILQMRKNHPKVQQESDKLWKNYKHATKKRVFFPGCNFSAFYPKTTDKLVAVLKEHGIGVIYDCCGKPDEELGAKPRKKFEAYDEIITACPNCYDYLGKTKK
ncbi:Rhodanese-like domain/cysteine-rich domain protein [Lachnospiraceae bacterium TWA4]|nr:Rhodanese-like domain/cysteine-rich domain protein [Lachnospiraceae bacterium TWA4]